jgi:hypothetical protein
VTEEREALAATKVELLAAQKTNRELEAVLRRRASRRADDRETIRILATALRRAGEDAGIMQCVAHETTEASHKALDSVERLAIANRQLALAHGELAQDYIEGKMAIRILATALRQTAEHRKLGIVRNARLDSEIKVLEAQLADVRKLVVECVAEHGGSMCAEVALKILRTAKA